MALRERIGAAWGALRGSTAVVVERAKAAVTKMLPWVQTYGEPNAEKVKDDFEQFARLAFGGNSVVFGLIDKRAKLFSEARFKFRRLSDKKLWGSPALEKLEKPWPNGATGELLTRMEQDASLAGNAYVRNCGNRLERLRPDWVTIVSWVTEDDLGNEVREVIGYMFEPVGDAERSIAWYPVEEVAHWSPIPDPLANFRGMSWLTPVLKEINADLAMTQHRDKFFRNAATPNIIIKYTGKMTSSQKIGLADSIAARHGGPENAGGTLVLDEGADPMIVGSKFSDAQFGELQAAGENRIAAAAGVPAIVAGLKEGLDAAAWSMYKQAMRAFADGTIRPNWRGACAALSVLIEVPDGSELWFDTADITALQEGEAEAAGVLQVQSAVMATLLANGYIADTVTAAVNAGDLTLLKHSGLVSVQLLPAAAPAPAAPVGDDAQRSMLEWSLTELTRALRVVEDLRTSADDDADVEPDFSSMALLTALEELEDSGVSRAREFNAAAHPRNPKGSPGGGRFRSLVDRLKDAIEAHAKGDGDGDPLEGFNRTQLRSVAAKRGIALKRGEPIESIKAKLLDDHGKSKAATSARPIRHPAIDAAIREALPGLPKGPHGEWTNIADIREALGTRFPRADVDQALIDLGTSADGHIIPSANSKALTPRDRAAAVRIGNQDAHAVKLDPPAPTRASAPTGSPARAELRTAATTEEGRAVVAKMSRDELRALAVEIGLDPPKSTTAKDLRTLIVKVTVDGRLVTAAMDDRGRRAAPVPFVANAPVPVTAVAPRSSAAKVPLDASSGLALPKPSPTSAVPVRSPAWTALRAAASVDEGHALVAKMDKGELYALAQEIGLNPSRSETAKNLRAYIVKVTVDGRLVTAAMDDRDKRGTPSQNDARIAVLRERLINGDIMLGADRSAWTPKQRADAEKIEAQLAALEGAPNPNPVSRR